MEEFVRFIRDIFETSGPIHLHEPRFIGKEKEFLEECIDTTFVSSVGKFVTRFEDIIASYSDSHKAIACVNGTAALHLSLKLEGASENTEVLTQPLTFIATVNAIMYTGAIPVFIDVDRNTLSISPNSLLSFLEEFAEVHDDGECYNKATGRRIAACIPMHTFGHPAKIDSIIEICDAFGVPVIEDAAESLGSTYKEKHTGTFGRMGVLSFNGNKIITTGGGGMILTNDPELGALAKHLTTQARLAHKWEFNHDRVGYNYRMPNINAALGVAQMENLPYFLSRKRELANRYREFCLKKGIEFVNEPENSNSNYWLCTILAKDLQERNRFLEITNEHGIMTRPAWTLMHHLPMFKEFTHQDLSVSEYLADRIVNLPSSVI